MTVEQMTILSVLGATVGLFLWGRFRHDVVALAALLACVATGLVPGAEAFSGFGHPAVITVACVLVLSSALQSTGVVDGLTRMILPEAAGTTVTLFALTGLAALLSGFMNNVGALALLMPVAIQVAKRLNLPPGKILMPLAFGSILGGMTTLIGTPPNLIVSGFRQSVSGTSFAMFDFAPVGIPVALVGLVFLCFVGWRLVPSRERKGTEGFETGAYFTEARVPEKSKSIGMTLRQLETELDGDAQVVGLIRDEERIPAPSHFRKVQQGDILIIEAEPDALAETLSRLDLKLEEETRTVADDDERPELEEEAGEPDNELDALQSNDVVLMELAVRPRAELVGRSATDIDLRHLFRINLLAIAREGNRSNARLRTTPIMAGDVLLMQGNPEAISAFANRFGCVPLAARPLRIPDQAKAILATASTGAADVIANALLNGVAGGSAIIALVLILLVTMILSDFMNNAATAAVMCPIALGTASQLGVNADPFLMAVAVGASCAFLTPIGHQNNTLILGPGGLRFGDYWRLGVPLEVLVTLVGVPMILLVWSL